MRRTIINHDKRYRAKLDSPRGFSFRCMLGLHRYESFTLDPAEFECIRCGTQKSCKDGVKYAN